MRLKNEISQKRKAALRMKVYLIRALRELVGKPPKELVEARYEKFRRMGMFLEEPLQTV